MADPDGAVCLIVLRPYWMRRVAVNHEQAVILSPGAGFLRYLEQRGACWGEDENAFVDVGDGWGLWVMFEGPDVDYLGL